MSDDYNDDLSKFETKLREILTQLQCKTEALDKSQEKLFDSQNLNCQLQILLENEKRTSNQLRQELKTAVEVIGRLEDDKIRGQTERARLEINWSTMQVERSHLLEQMKKLKLENVDLKRKNEAVEVKVAEAGTLNESIGASVSEVRDQVVGLQAVMTSNLEKLKREQEQLFVSFKFVSQFHSKIENISQIILKNTQKDKRLIEDLKEKLAVMEIMQTSMETETVPLKPIIETETNDFAEKLKLTADIDQKLNEICKKLLSTSFDEATNKTNW